MPCLIFILPSPHMIYKFFSLCYNEFNTFLGGVEMTTNVDLEKLQKMLWISSIRASPVQNP